MLRCYHCPKCSKTFERDVKRDEHKDSAPCPECSADSDRDFGAEHNGPKIGAKWPIVSYALAENDVDAARDRCKRHGIATDFNEDGCPIFTSEGHRKQYTNALKKETGIGWQDRSAWY